MTLEGARSFTFAAAGSRDLRLHVFSPASTGSPRPAILLFFGGGWRTGRVDALAPQAKAFAARGYVAVLADYRVKCRDRTPPRAAVEDGRQAWAWLRTHARELGVDSDRVLLGGASSGGQIALVTAIAAPVAERPAGLVLFNLVVDMVAEAWPWDRAAARAISPLVLSPESLPPTLILQGQDDRRTPIGPVRAFCDRASEAGRDCRIREYPGEGHSFYTRRRAKTGEAAAPYADTLAAALAFADSVTAAMPTRRNP